MPPFVVAHRVPACIFSTRPSIKPKHTYQLGSASVRHRSIDPTFKTGLGNSIPHVAGEQAMHWTALVS
jgi:hypothetical protein